MTPSSAARRQWIDRCRCRRTPASRFFSGGPHPSDAKWAGGEMRETAVVRRPGERQSNNRRWVTTQARRSAIAVVGCHAVLSLRQLQFTFRHEEALHGNALIEAAEEGGRGVFGQFIAFGRLFSVTIGFAQWVQHNPLRISFRTVRSKAECTRELGEAMSPRWLQAESVGRGLKSFVKLCGGV